MNGWLSRLLVSHREGAPDRLQPHPPRQTHNLKKKVYVSVLQNIYIYIFIYIYKFIKKIMFYVFIQVLCVSRLILYSILNTLKLN